MPKKNKSVEVEAKLSNYGPTSGMMGHAIGGEPLVVGKDRISVTFSRFRGLGVFELLLEELVEKNPSLCAGTDIRITIEAV